MKQKNGTGQAGRATPGEGRMVGRTHVPVVLLMAVLPIISAPDRGSAQGWEVGGGSVGSVVGFGAGLLFTASADDGLPTLARNIVVGSALGAAGGAYLAGRVAGNDPSILGSVLGAAVGTLTGIAVAGVLDDALKGEPSGVIYLGYTVSQGSLAGLGAWLLRDRRSEGEGVDPSR